MLFRSFKTRMKGEGVWAELIRARFHSAARRAGCGIRRVDLSVDQFIRPFAAANPVVLSRLKGVRNERDGQPASQLPARKTSHIDVREAGGQLPLLF